MKTYCVTVKRLVPQSKLDMDDLHEWPRPETEICIEADNKEEALDEFHANNAIAVLDDFEITIEEIKF